MFTEDLQVLATDKDVSKSCIFGFPDRPEDSFPPNFPPIDPPTCYPYCPPDDWPPVIFPPPPILPPNVIPHPGFIPVGINGSVSTADVGGFAETPYGSINVTGLGTLTGVFGFIDNTQYLGGEATAEDNIVLLGRDYSANVFLEFNFGVDVNKLVSAFPYASLFLIEILCGASSSNPVITHTVPLFSSIFNTDNLSIVYSHNSIAGDPFPNGIFRWYITRTLELFSYAEVNGVQIFPNIVLP